MAYIVDLIISALLLLSVFIGCKRGLVKTVFSCLSVVAALISAYFFGPYVGEFIRTTDFYEDMCENISDEICECFDTQVKDGIEKADIVQNTLSNIPFSENLERIGVNLDELNGKYRQLLQNGADNVRDAIAEDASTVVLRGLSNALGMLITFIVSLIVLRILSKLLDKIASLPVLNAVNKAGGCAAGAVLGVLGVYVLCMAVEILMPYIPKNDILYMGMDKDTVLYSFFVNLNPLILILFA